MVGGELLLVFSGGYLMPHVRVSHDAHSKLKVLYVVLSRLGRAESVGDVVDYLISLSPLEDLLRAKSAKELAMLYMQLTSKSWSELNAELTRACGSGLDGADKEVEGCIEEYLRSRMGLNEVENLLIKT